MPTNVSSAAYTGRIVGTTSQATSAQRHLRDTACGAGQGHVRGLRLQHAEVGGLLLPDLLPLCGTRGPASSWSARERRAGEEREENGGVRHHRCLLPTQRGPLGGACVGAVELALLLCPLALPPEHLPLRVALGAADGCSPHATAGPALTGL